MARKVGIQTVAYFMVGTPTERTRRDVHETIDYAIRLDPDYVMFNVMTPFPGTTLYDEGLADDNRWIRTEDAQAMIKRLAREEGLLVGLSAGAAVCAAMLPRSAALTDELCFLPPFALYLPWRR